MSGDGDAPDFSAVEDAGAGAVGSERLRSRAAAWTGADAVVATADGAAGATPFAPIELPLLFGPAPSVADAEICVSASGSGSHGAGNPPHGEVSGSSSAAMTGSTGSPTAPCCSTRGARCVG